MNSRRRWLLVALGFAILVVGLFHGVLFPPAGHILFGDDYLSLLYYQRTFFHWSLSHATLPFWNPYLYGGIPILEHPQTAFWYPLNLLLLLLPAQTAYPVDLSFHLFIAMTTMYFFMRRWVGRLPAIFSGIAYGMSTFFWYRIPAGHSNVIAAAAWTPLVFALFWRVWDIRKRFEIKRDVPIIIVAGMAFAVQLLSGYKTIGVLTAEAIGIACLFISINRKSVRPILYSLFAGVIGLLLDAVELVANQQYILKSVFSIHLPYQWAAVGTPTLNHILEIIDPVAYELRNPTDLYLIHERAAYVGGIALVLALIAIVWTIVKKRKEPIHWIFFILCIFGLWVGFAYLMPIDLFAFLKTHLPWYGSIRVPPRHFFWFVLGASALAGLGAEIFNKKIIQLLFIGVLLWQLVPIAKSQLYLAAEPEVSVDHTLISYLQTHESLNRYLETGDSSSNLQNILPLDAPAEYHIYSLFGYLPPPILGYYKYFLAVNHIPMSDIYKYVDTIPPYDNLYSPYTDALNIKYIIEPVASDNLASDTSGKFHEIYENAAAGWRIYENKNAFPRFYMVPDARILPTSDEVFKVINEESVNPKDTVLLAREDVTGYIPQGNCQNKLLGAVTVQEYNPTSIHLQTNNHCDGFLMSSEIYYPGWQASIDGKNTPIWQGNLAFRVIFVPAGIHTIVYRYIPTALYLGMLISIITFITCIVILWKTYRSRVKTNVV